MSRRSKFLALGAACLLLGSTALTALAFSNGENASVVIGQPNFTSRTPATSQSGLSYPRGVAFDSAGNLWVADTGNSRILEFAKGNGFADGEDATLVIGQPNFDSNTSAATQSGLTAPEGIAFDRAGDLWVADSGNNRVLEFALPFKDGENASIVIGQSDFDADGNATTQSGLDLPTGLAFDSRGDLWVVDQGNDRILEFAPPFSDGENASLVIGQQNFTAKSLPTIGGDSLLLPSSVVFDSSGDLWVSDQFNYHALEFPPPFTDDEQPSVALGNGISLTATPQNLNFPAGLAFDSSGNLWVSDSLDGRVIAYAPPFVTNESASVVVGEPDFTTGGVFSTTPTTQSGLRDPQGIAFDLSGNLWVADMNNNRVVEFPATGSTTTTSSSSPYTGPSISYNMQLNVTYQQVSPLGGTVEGSAQLGMPITINQTGPTRSSVWNPLFLGSPAGTLLGLGFGNGTWTGTACGAAAESGNYSAIAVARGSLSNSTVQFSYITVGTSFSGCVAAENADTVTNLVESCFSSMPNITNGACSSFPLAGGTNELKMGPNASSGNYPYTSISGSVKLTVVNSTGVAETSTETAPEFPSMVLGVVVFVSLAAVALVSSRAREPDRL